MMRNCVQILGMSVLLMGCVGTPLVGGKDVSAKGRDALLPYYLPRGEVAFDVSYSANAGLNISKPELLIVPDFDQRFTLAYTRSDLSNDDIEIKTQNGLLTLISSKPEDQTVKLVEQFNEVLTQWGKVQAAVAKSNAETMAQQEAGGQPPQPQPCPDLKTLVRVDLTYYHDKSEGGKYLKSDLKHSKACEIKIENLQVTYEEGLKGNNVTAQKPPDICNDSVVCFRVPQGYTLTAQIRVYQGTTILGEDLHLKLEMLAPAVNPIGYLGFDRRAFVKNEKTITFDRGMVTQINMKDPSSLVGFFNLPVAVLKSTTIIVAPDG